MVNNRRCWGAIRMAVKTHDPHDTLNEQGAFKNEHGSDMLTMLLVSAVEKEQE